MTTTYEYKHETWPPPKNDDGTITVHDGAPETLEQYLNALGAEGWELVAIHRVRTGREQAPVVYDPIPYECTLKRAIAERVR